MSAPGAGILADTPANGSLPALKIMVVQNGTYAPTNTLFGEFSVLKPGTSTRRTTQNIPLSDFIGKYILSESRTLTPEEEPTVPSLPDWYIIPPEIKRICEHAKLCRKFPGVFKQGIELNNLRMVETMPSLKDQIDRKYKDFSIIANLLPQYCRSGTVNNPSGYSGPYLDTLSDCIPYVEDSLYHDDIKERFHAVNHILVILWEYIKPLIEEMGEDLKKNVPKEVLETHYKQPYEALIQQINQTATDFANKVVSDRLLINPNISLDEQIAVINHTIKQSGMVREMGRTLYRTYDVQSLHQIALNLRKKVEDALSPFLAMEDCLVADPSDIEKTPIIYNTITKQVYDNDAWIDRELDPDGKFLIYIRPKTEITSAKEENNEYPNQQSANPYCSPVAVGY